MASVDVESVLFGSIDRFRDLVAPDASPGVQLMDMSKNDALTMLFLLRRDDARMGDIAEYLHTPLNTATGVVGRLTRRGFVTREHSPADKRVVVIALTDAGRAFARDAVATLTRYVSRLFDQLDADEVALLFGVIDKVLAILSEDASPAPASKPRRIPVE